MENRDNISTTAINVQEVLYGLRKTKKLKRAIEFFCGMRIIPYNFKAAIGFVRLYRELERRGSLININDIMISASMIANNVEEIVTRNIRDFKRISEISRIKLVPL